MGRGIKVEGGLHAAFPENRNNGPAFLNTNLHEAAPLFAGFEGWVSSGARTLIQWASCYPTVQWHATLYALGQRA